MTRIPRTNLLAFGIGGLALLAAILAAVLATPENQPARPAGDRARVIDDASRRASGALGQVIAAAQQVTWSAAGWRKSAEDALGDARGFSTGAAAEVRSLILLRAKTDELQARLREPLGADALRQSTHAAFDGVTGSLAVHCRTAIEAADAGRQNAVNQAVTQLSSALAQSLAAAAAVVARANSGLAQTATLLGQSGGIQASAADAAARARTLQALAGQLASAPDSIAIARVSGRIDAESASTALLLQKLESQLAALGRAPEARGLRAGRGALAFARELLIGGGGLAAAVTSQIEAPPPSAFVDSKLVVAIACGFLAALIVAGVRARNALAASDARGSQFRAGAVAMATRILQVAAGLRRMPAELMSPRHLGGMLGVLGLTARNMGNAMHGLRAAASEAAEAGASATAIAASAATHAREAQVATARAWNRAAEMRALGTRTRLLAVTAALEATHAGESGRAFLVVANEVKRLAGSIAESAEEVQRAIGAAQREAAAAAGSVAEVRGIVNRLRRMHESVEARAAEYSEATSDVLEAVARMRTDSLPLLARQLTRVADEVEGKPPVMAAPTVVRSTPVLLPAPVREKSLAAPA